MATGQGISGATVEAWQASLHGVNWSAQPWLAGHVEGAYITTADEQGRYAFSALPDGDYVVRAMRPGHARQYYDATPFSGQAKTVPVIAQQEAPGIDFHLSASTTIYGTIFQADGVTPIGGAEVLVRPSEYYFDQGFWARTDSTGQYEVANLYPGNFRVTARAEGYVDRTQYFYKATAWLNAADVAVTSQVLAAGVDINLDRSGTISGQVKAKDSGAPLANVKVAAHETTGAYGRDLEGQTRQDGTYSLAGIPAGNYLVYTTGDAVSGYAGQYYQGKDASVDADAVSVSAGEDTSNIDFGLEPGGKITGRVFAKETGQPLADISLYACPPDGYCWLPATTRTAYDGSYSLALKPGEYRITAGFPERSTVNIYGSEYLPEWYPDAHTLEKSAPLQVNAGQEISAIDFHLAHYGSISGHIYDATGKPLGGVKIEARSTDAQESGLCYCQTTAISQPDGSFRIRGLLSSNHYMIRATKSGFASGDYASYVSVQAPSDTPEISFSLQPQNVIYAPAPGNQVSSAVLDDQKIYWSVVPQNETASAGSGSLMATALGTGNAVTLATGQVNPRALALDDRNLYWVSGGGPEAVILRMDKRNETVSTFWSGGTDIASLAVDGENVYWVACAQQPQVTGTIMKMNRDGGPAEVISQEKTCPKITAAGDSLYWIEGGLNAVAIAGGSSRAVITEKDLRDPQFLIQMRLGLSEGRTNIGLERIVRGDASGIYFLVFVDSNPGMVSCSDQSSVLIRRTNAGGTYTQLARLPRGAANTTAGNDVVGFTSDSCGMGLTIINLQTSAKAEMEWQRDWKVMAVDEQRVFWIAEDGALKEVFR